MSAYDPTQTLASLFALVLNQKTEVTERRIAAQRVRIARRRRGLLR